MQNAGRGIWRKFSGLSRERWDGWVVTLDLENFKRLIFIAQCTTLYNETYLPPKLTICFQVNN
jgi:hypothetical protein